MTNVVSVGELVDRYVQLDLECLDRIYLNAHVPNLQVPGQVAMFMTGHLGCPIPSPAIMSHMGDRFRAAVGAFVAANDIPVLRFKADDRQIDMVRPLWQHATGPGVVAVGIAQEFQKVFTAHQRPTRDPKARVFAFDKCDRRATVYYFYVLDADFGPGFIKICSYFPYPAKVWVNGHEWAKRQATKAGLDWVELANGFASCDDPRRLQRICDRLGPAHIQSFFERWMKVGLHQQEPPSLGEPAARPALHTGADDLRPPTTPPQRPRSAHPPHQHLRPHHRRHPGRCDLHQARPPPPPPPPRTRHPEPRQALNTIDNAVTSYITNARLAIAA